MVHVAYRLYDGDGYYAKLCGTSMLSIFENTRAKVTIHIMHNERLTPDNRDKFCYIAGQYNQRVEFHDVEEIAGPTLRKFEATHPNSTRWGAAWYPFIVHEVFPNLNKLILIGTDTIINLDIAELWACDLGEYGFGAVTEKVNEGPAVSINKMLLDKVVENDDYFNCDVLLLKPKFFQENFEKILQGCKFVYENGYPFVEQDVMNYLFSKTFLKLPRKFDCLIGFFKGKKEFIVGEEIYHYAGINHKPSLDTVSSDVTATFNRLYFNYFLKTPWANPEIFGNLHRHFAWMLGKTQSFLLHYTNLLASRERVFLVHKDKIENMRRLFKIKDDEQVVDVSDPVARGKFLDTANEIKGKKLIFVLSDYVTIKNELFQRNLVENEDFVDALIFLSEKDGGNWRLYNSRSIVARM